MKLCMIQIRYMNAPIGIFDTSETSDNIVLGNKYDNIIKKNKL